MDASERKQIDDAMAALRSVDDHVQRQAGDKELTEYLDHQMRGLLHSRFEHLLDEYHQEKLDD